MVAYERRNPDLDPQPVWRGKDMKDWSDLVVQAPPLYIQEKVHPKVLVDDLRRRTEDRRRDRKGRPHRDPAPTSSPTSTACRTTVRKPSSTSTTPTWSNRMILGDSLQVMASLAEREGLRGKVQCIYLDPPYGIRFNSNFQWSTTSRDVKDGKADHISPRAGAGEGVPGYLAGGDPLISDVSSGSADCGAGSAGRERFDIPADRG